MSKAPDWWVKRNQREAYMDAFHDKARKKSETKPKLMDTIYRGWINQPSKLNTHHHLHGTRCIVVDNGEGRSVQVWFTEGPVYSMQVLRKAISKAGV